MTKDKLPISPLLLWSIVGILYAVSFLVIPDIRIYSPFFNKRILSIILIIWMTWLIWCLIVNRQKFRDAGNITKIVKHGPYAVVRHPIYMADLIAILIIIMAYPAMWMIIGSCMAVPIIIYWAKKEEYVLKQKFGTEYEDYARAKSAFNPFPFLIAMIMGESS